MTDKKLVLVSGYARSGKSYLANQLRQHGISYSSSSDILSREALKYFHIPVNQSTLKVLEEKDEDTFQALLVNHCKFFFHPENYEQEQALRAAEKSIRHAKIFVAEETIVPVHGRKYFAENCLKNLPLGDDLGVVFTTIPDEHSEFFRLIPSMFDGKVILVNLRSRDELQGVDIRGLFKWNDLMRESQYEIRHMMNEKISAEETFHQFLEAIA